MNENPKLNPDPKDAYLILNCQVVPIQNAEFRIGRNIENDLVVNIDTVSRHHSVIKEEAGKFVLYDNESTGGTFVNKKRIQSCVLNSGDLISVADVTLMFVENNTKFLKRSSVTTSGLIEKASSDLAYPIDSRR